MNVKFVDNPAEADVILVGFPMDKGTENPGCADAPSEIRKGLDNFYFSENASENKIYDASDVVESNDFEETGNKIRSKIKELLKHDKPIISIGGNHSITYFILKEILSSHKDTGIVFIDAHPDCQKNYFPFGDVITESIEAKIPMVLVGIRNWSKDEFDMISKHKIPFVPAKNFSCKKTIELVKETIKSNKIYISVDIDVVDPAFAPGTGCIEPGGITSRELLETLDKLIREFRVVGMDLVEVNPSKDVNSMTVNLASKIVLESVDSPYWKN